MKFVGFALLELVKATGQTDVETARTYDKHGNIVKKNMKLNEIERDWCKVRKTQYSHAVMLGSQVKLLFGEQFQEQLIEWKTLAA
jgi:hypothetical protein